MDLGILVGCSSVLTIKFSAVVDLVATQQLHPPGYSSAPRKQPSSQIFMAAHHELKKRTREDYPYILEYRTRWFVPRDDDPRLNEPSS
jgi:hypothetical protein